MSKKKVGLAARLEDMVAAEKARRATREAAAGRAERARQKAVEAKAARIYGSIERLARDALRAGLDHVRLYENADVAGTVALCDGVAGHLRDWLTADGLGGQLWVDRDASGNHTIKNALILTLPGGHRRG